MSSLTQCYMRIMMTASAANCDAVIAGDWPHGWRICLMGTRCRHWYSFTYLLHRSFICRPAIVSLLCLSVYNYERFWTVGRVQPALFSPVCDPVNHAMCTLLLSAYIFTNFFNLLHFGTVHCQCCQNNFQWLLMVSQGSHFPDNQEFCFDWKCQEILLFVRDLCFL